MLSFKRWFYPCAAGRQSAANQKQARPGISGQHLSRTPVSVNSSQVSLEGIAGKKQIILKKFIAGHKKILYQGCDSLDSEIGFELQFCNSKASSDW